MINRLTLWYAWLGHLAFIVLMPLGFFIIQYQYTAGSLATEAEILADRTSRFVGRNPEMWIYEQARLTELLVEHPVQSATRRRIVDRNGRVVAANGTVAAAPVMMRTSDLRDSGATAGRLELTRSLRPLLIQTGMVALVGLSLGLMSLLMFHFLYARARKAEKMLNLQSAIMETAAEAIFLIGLDDLKIKRTNGKIEELFGYDPKEMIGMPIDSVVAPSEKKPSETRLFTMEAIAKTGEAHTELINVRKDGTTFWSYIHASLFDHPEFGRVIVAAHTDITERKLAENALRESEDRLRHSEERYRNILDNMENAYYEVDLAGNFTFFNPAAMVNLGYTKDEMMSMNFRRYMDRENAQKVFKVFHQVFVTGESAKASEWELFNKAGTRVAAESSISLIRDAEGKPVGFRGVISDVTERKKAERRLLESEKKYRLLAENATDIIFTTDTHLRFTYLSPSVQRLRGYTVEEAIAQSPEEIMTPASYELAFGIVTEEMEMERNGSPATNRVHVLELEQTCKDGSHIWTETTYTPLRDEQNRFTGFLGMTRDITERRRAEEEKRHREMLQGLLEMAGAVCHEMNQPMQIISGLSELLMMHAPADTPIHDKLSVIVREVRRMKDITGKLMTLRQYKTKDYAGFARIVDIHERQDDTAN
jgi:PAS domain S-box-containing protein